jgi:hypothetical protein
MLVEESVAGLGDLPAAVAEGGAGRDRRVSVASSGVDEGRPTPSNPFASFGEPAVKDVATAEASTTAAGKATGSSEPSIAGAGAPVDGPSGAAAQRRVPLAERISQAAAESDSDSDSNSEASSSAMASANQQGKGKGSLAPSPPNPGLPLSDSIDQ